MYEYLKEKGIDVKMNASFLSNFKIYYLSLLKVKYFREETMLNSISYSKRILDEINLEKSSILHIANA